MSIENGSQVTPEQNEPPIPVGELYGVGKFEEMLVGGLSTVCNPCYVARVAFVREHALLFSVRNPDVTTAILRLEEDLMPCMHIADNSDIELAVLRRISLNRANA